MKIAHFILLVLLNSELFAQDIYFQNPSFEGMPGRSRLPPEWRDCGSQFPGESPPDTHPSGAWRVYTPPMHGKTYVGMVVRENGSWESISQMLSSPLLKGKIYEFQIGLAQSIAYLSPTRKSIATGELFNYNSSVKLRIWGSNYVCDKKILLSESQPISNKEWRTYIFTFSTTKNVRFITLEAYYNDDKKDPYNGHILLDKASSFIEVPE